MAFGKCHTFKKVFGLCCKIEGRAIEYELHTALSNSGRYGNRLEIRISFDDR